MGRSLILILIFFFLGPSLALGDTIYVPQQHAEIQLAIEAASDGDTILVAPNLYFENINFTGKAITLRSDVDGDPTTHDISPMTTSIDGNQKTRVVTFNMGEGSDSVLDGFTITGGRHVIDGAGIFCGSGSAPTLLNNIIRGNRAYGFLTTALGGGIYCKPDSSPHIHNHLVHDNSAVTTFKTYLLPSYGGGIYVSSSALITNSTITQNEVPMGEGGGIYASSDTVIVDTIIWNNIGSEIYGNPTVTYSNIEWQIWPGTGNISQDPLFFLPFFFYFQLNQDPPQPGTFNPCVDAGDPDTPMFDGSTRTDGVQDMGRIDMGFHYPTTTTLYAIPDVKANGVDSPLTVSVGTNIDITVSLAPQDKAGFNADWWMLNFTSHPPPYDVWSYDLNLQSFVPGFFPTFQGPLPSINIPTTSLFEGTSVPEGTYYVFFIIDLNMNGVLDPPIYLDFVMGTVL